MRKTTGNINRNRYTLSLWVLIVMVAFYSSCTIHKGLQANFEIPVTKQLNPSKAVSNQQLACQYAEGEVRATLLVPETVTGSGFVPPIQEDTFKPTTCFYNKKSNVTSGWPLTSKVGSYILFRQMKTWITPQAYLLQDYNQG